MTLPMMRGLAPRGRWEASQGIGKQGVFWTGDTPAALTETIGAY